MECLGGMGISGRFVEELAPYGEIMRLELLSSPQLAVEDGV